MTHYELIERPGVFVEALQVKRSMPARERKAWNLRPHRRKHLRAPLLLDSSQLGLLPVRWGDWVIRDKDLNLSVTDAESFARHYKEVPA